MNFNIFNIIIICASVQGIVFSSIVLSSKRYKKRTHQFLALIVLVISLSNFDYWFRDTGISSLWEHYKLSYIPYDLLILPLFYFFVTSYLQLKKKNAKYLLLPFLIRFCVQVLSVFYILFFKELFVFPSSVRRILLSIDEYGTILFILFVVYLSFKTIIDYNSNNQKSNPAIVVIETKWLKQLLYLAIGLCIFWLGTVLFDDFIPRLLSSKEKYYILWLGLSAIIYWLGYAGIYHVGIFNQRQHIRDDFSNRTEVSARKTKRINLNKDRFEEIDQTIKAEKLYLDTLISLNSLSERFEISEGYLSQLINNHTNINFSTYINELRVEEAKSLLLNEKYKNYTIVAIALESGFNSKSVFYTVFKKSTGRSPSAFKKQNLS